MLGVYQSSVARPFSLRACELRTHVRGYQKMQCNFAIARRRAHFNYCSRAYARREKGLGIIHNAMQLSLINMYIHVHVPLYCVKQWHHMGYTVCKNFHCLRQCYDSVTAPNFTVHTLTTILSGVAGFVPSLLSCLVG